MRRTGVIAGAVTLTLLVACSATPAAGPRIVRVPEDAATATEGLARLRPGDMLLLGPGEYHEELLVQTPDVTVRGVDRDGTVLDGQGTLEQGVVVVADGVRVQNLTVRSYLANGVLVTGLHDGAQPMARGMGGYEPVDPADYPPLERFSIDHVTAYNNGLYGLYAFNARHGEIVDSYASGAANAGIYVGQCEDCDIVVRGNVMEGNALGLENGNASGPLSVVGNRVVANRVGMSFSSSHQEAFLPQRDNLVAGNVVLGNASPSTPAHAEGLFGIGIGVAGGVGNHFLLNRVEGHPVAGFVVTSSADLASQGTSIERTVFAGNAVDVVDTSAPYAPATGTCVAGSPGALVSPASLLECVHGPSEPGRVDPVEVPPGKVFLGLPEPPTQPSLADVETISGPLPARPAHPQVPTEVPPAHLLADRSHA